MKINKSFIIGLVITLLLLGGIVVAFYLSQQNQDVRQRAAEPTSEPKPFGKAVVLDGTTTFFEVPSADRTLTTPPFTIEFWAKPEDLGNNTNQFLFGLNNLASLQACIGHLAIFTIPSTENGKYSVGATMDDGSASVALPSSTSLFPYGSWAHIALVIDELPMIQDNAGDTIQAKLFINGQPTGALTLSGVHEICSDSTIFIGRKDDAIASANSGFIYKGQLDELRISNNVRYTETFVPATTPFSPDQNTLSLWHFNGVTTDEMTNKSLQEHGAVSYVDSTIAAVTPPVCQATTSTCSWDPVDSAVSYHYKVTTSVVVDGPTPPGNGIVVEGDTQAPATSITFISEANKTYTCEVSATSVCGPGAKASTTTTCVVPTATPPVPTNTPTPVPTGTPPPTPTNTPVPPTGTPVPPTPTNTPVPPAATNTPVVPTATTAVVPPTATNAPVVPTATDTPIPGVPTNTPTPTIASPGSPIETFAITGAILMTIIGALLLFAL